MTDACRQRREPAQGAAGQDVLLPGPCPSRHAGRPMRRAGTQPRPRVALRPSVTTEGGAPWLRATRAGQQRTSRPSGRTLVGGGQVDGQVAGRRCERDQPKANVLVHEISGQPAGRKPVQSGQLIVNQCEIEGAVTKHMDGVEIVSGGLDREAGRFEDAFHCGPLHLVILHEQNARPRWLALLAVCRTRLGVVIRLALRHAASAPPRPLRACRGSAEQ